MPHKPVSVMTALNRDELVKLESLYPKRQNTVGLKMYVHFGIRGMEVLVQKSLEQVLVQKSLEQAMKQDVRALMNPELINDPESEYTMKRMKDQ